MSPHAEPLHHGICGYDKILYDAVINLFWVKT